MDKRIIIGLAALVIAGWLIGSGTVNLPFSMIAGRSTTIFYNADGTLRVASIASQLSEGARVEDWVFCVDIDSGQAIGSVPDQAACEGFYGEWRTDLNPICVYNANVPANAISIYDDQGRTYTAQGTNLCWSQGFTEIWSNSMKPNVVYIQFEGSPPGPDCVMNADCPVREGYAASCIGGECSYTVFPPEPPEEESQLPFMLAMMTIIIVILVFIAVLVKIKKG